MWKGSKIKGRCWGKHDRHRPFMFFCFHSTNVSDAGRVCDVFSQNSRRQSNCQNFTAVVYRIEVLIFPVSIPLHFDTSVYKLQGHQTLAYAQGFKKIKLKFVLLKTFPVFPATILLLLLPGRISRYILSLPVDFFFNFL